MPDPRSDRPPARAGGGEHGQTGGRQPDEARGQTPTIACPFCGSDQTELFSLFGSSLLTSQYYCRACRSAFERVKWGDAPRV